MVKEDCSGGAERRKLGFVTLGEEMVDGAKLCSFFGGGAGIQT